MNSESFRLSIHWAENGWMVKDSDGLIHVVDNSEDDDGVTSSVALLHLILDILGLYGNRYDKRRISISIKKGDKYEGD